MVHPVHLCLPSVRPLHRTDSSVFVASAPAFGSAFLSAEGLLIHEDSTRVRKLHLLSETNLILFLDGQFLSEALYQYEKLFVLHDLTLIKLIFTFLTSQQIRGFSEENNVYHLNRTSQFDDHRVSAQFVVVDASVVGMRRCSNWTGI